MIVKPGLCRTALSETLKTGFLGSNYTYLLYRITAIHRDKTVATPITPIAIHIGPASTGRHNINSFSKNIPHDFRNKAHYFWNKARYFRNITYYFRNKAKHFQNKAHYFRITTYYFRNKTNYFQNKANYFWNKASC